MPSDKKIDPQIIINGGRHPSLHRLEKHGNKLELWYHAPTPIPAENANCGYEDPDQPGTDNANGFRYHLITAPQSLTQNPATTVGAQKTLGQEKWGDGEGPIRCMPARYRQSRNTPFRLEWTFDFLYSRTGDPEGNAFGGPPEHHYIVRTRMETQTP